MAGNIIPAIATTNAIIAGVVVLHAFRVLEEDLESCKSVYLRQKANHRNMLIVPEKRLNPPNPTCYVCSKREASLSVDVTKMTLKELEENVCKKGFHMIAPDVMNPKGDVVIDSDEPLTIGFKTLEQVGIVDGCQIGFQDFQQDFDIRVRVTHREKPPVNSELPEFLINDLDKCLEVKAEPAKADTNSTNGEVCWDSISNCNKRVYMRKSIKTNFLRSLTRFKIFYANYTLEKKMFEFLPLT